MSKIMETYTLAFEQKKYDLWLDYTFYDWDELEGELVQECLSRLRTRDILPDVQGYHNQMKPFMAAHGYRDGHGWWIRDGSKD